MKAKTNANPIVETGPTIHDAMIMNLAPAIFGMRLHKVADADRWESDRIILEFGRVGSIKNPILDPNSIAIRIRPAAVGAFAPTTWTLKTGADLEKATFAIRSKLQVFDSVARHYAETVNNR